MKLTFNPLTSEFDYVGASDVSVGKPFITNITSSNGIVSQKVFAENTIPKDYVLMECRTDGTTVNIHFVVQGALEKWSPVCYVDGIECTNLKEHSTTKRFFYGSVTIPVIEMENTVSVSTDIGIASTVIVRKASDPPVATSVKFVGNYPAGQTEVKENDTFQIEVLFDSAEEEPAKIEVENYGACKAKTYSVSGFSSTILSIIDYTGITPQLLKARLRFQNEFGSWSAWSETENEVLCNDLSPSFIDMGTTFPVGQLAFKDNETGTQETVINNADSVVYSSNNDDFTITNTSTYTPVKAIEFNNVLHYNDSVPNFTIQAVRYANGSVSIFEKIIEVANTTPTVIVSQESSRLQSSPSGEPHEITVVSNQNLLNTPDIEIPVSGTWQTSFSGGGKNFTRTILIYDSDQKGIGDWFFNIVATNRAGIPALIQGQQNVGGFVERIIPLPAFLNKVLLNTSVVDTTKLKFAWNFKENMVFAPIGTLPPVVFGWTIDGVGKPITEIIMLDIQATSASSQESLITISEEI